MLKIFNILNILNAFKKHVLFPLFFILFFSIISLYSINDSFNFLIYKQIMYIFISLIIFCVIVSVDIKIFYNLSYFSLLFIYIVLIMIFPFGKNVLGSSRWLNLGIVTMQPSEFAKIIVILSLARFFTDFNFKKHFNISAIFLAGVLILPSVILTMLQPDLATSIVILFISITMFVVIGIKKKYFIFTFFFILTIAPFIWTKFLKKYQKLRIINFLKPDNDPFGSGYNIMQSKIAIGSGGLFGKGIFNNTQEKLDFLPETHTDFIFTSICEEFGFIGACIIIMMYLWIIYYGMIVVEKSKKVFYKLVAVGCTSLIFAHFFINISMISGLLPAAGIPLIFMSYGGSNLIVGFICIALIINIDLRNNKELY